MSKKSKKLIFHSLLKIRKEVIFMYVVIGSSTMAARLKKSVEKIVGFPAYVVHTPSELRNGGCSYSVRLDDRALIEIRRIAVDNGINIKGIYTEKNENGERVFYAVS